MALRTILKLSCDEEVQDLQVFGDSAMLIDFMNIKNFLNINLHDIGSKIKQLAGAFNSFCICCIYREQNEWEDALSKEGLLLTIETTIYNRNMNDVEKIKNVVLEFMERKLSIIVEYISFVTFCVIHIIFL